MKFFKKAKQMFAKSLNASFALCIILSFVICFFASSSIINKRNTRVNLTESISPSELLVIGYSIDDNKYVPISSDPQIYIPTIGSEINDVTIVLSKPLSSQLICQLYYAVNNDGLSESNSLTVTAKKGQKEINLSLSKNIYTNLRLDVNETFNISSISLSNLEIEKEYKSVYVDWLGLFLTFSLISLLIVCGFVWRKRIISIFRLFKNRFFSENNLTPSKNPKNTEARWFALISTLSCFLLVFIIPPLTIPDEIAHFLNVLKVSHFNFFPIIKDGAIGTYLSSDEIAFITNYSDVFNAHMDIRNILSREPALSLATEFYSTNNVYINPFAYFLPGFGIAISRVLMPGISIYDLFLIARLINASFFIVVTYWALSITPILKKTMFLLALMPMTLHQCISTSYDALIIPSSFLLFAYATKIISENDDYRIQLTDVFAICLSCGVLFCTKYAYIPLVFIMLSVSIKKFGSIKKYFGCIGLIAIIGIVFFLIPESITSSILSISPKSELQIAYQEYLKQNLFVAKDIIIDTSQTFCKPWSTEFIGILGWMNIQIPQIFILIYKYVLILMITIELSQINGISLKTRLLSVFGYFIFFSGTILALYLQHNPILGKPVGITISYGFQGRYLIPAILFLFIAFANPILTKFKHLNKINKASETIMLTTSVSYVILITFILVGAYWM